MFVHCCFRLSEPFGARFAIELELGLFHLLYEMVVVTCQRRKSPLQ